uniref:SCP domain-containing protein n=1 Tax=Otolemur garnettii TaxID=30611 RepID=H0X2D6_OTOGA
WEKSAGFLLNNNISLFLMASKSSALPSITDTTFINECVDAHNSLRRQVSPPAADMKFMGWDKNLAKTASAWAHKCKIAHNDCLDVANGCHAGFAFVGENLWTGGEGGFSPHVAVNSWYNETAFYNFETLSCSKVCGHYTQVVWANTYKIGCAVAKCPNLGGSTVVFICNYGPT